MPHKISDTLYPVTDKFGWRIHPVYKTRKFHTGTDHKMPHGTTIKSVANGIVKEADFRSKTFGGRVVIEHTRGRAKGYRTSYNHLSQINVKVDSYVYGGQEIGKSGGTPNTYGAGTSSGPHLHFEVYKPGFDLYQDKYINKEAVVDPEQYWDIIEQD